MKLSDYLVYTEGGYLAWESHIDDLKEFVQKSLNFDGKWSSPGGDVKVFENEKYCLKWYGVIKKKLLIVRDDEQQNLSERMQSLATKSVNINSKTSSAIGKENNMAELHIVHDSDVDDKSLYMEGIENSLVEDLRRQMQEFAESTNLKIEGLEIDVNNLKARSVPMFVMEATVKELKIDKDNLVRENAELREKNLNFALITSDLNSKVKELEHERDSLVTAMKLQQQEFEQGHYERQDGEKWKTVSGIKQSKEDQATMNFELNRYDVLNDEANTQNSDLHASVIEINSETQQPTTGQNMAVDNDNIFPEKGDNASNCPKLTHDTIQGNKGNSSRATEHTPVKGRVPTQGIVIIGDSIIKNVNPVKLSKRRVQKYTYPGKTTPEINNELTKINIQLPPSHVIVHTGTNDVPVETTEKCVSNMEELIMLVKQKFPNSKIGISGITPRQDIDLTLKIKEINEKVQTLSSKHGVKFINNLSIDKTCLNSSKLHLNAKGSAILASHFIKFLRDGQSLSSLHPKKHPKQDFPMSTINQLGELLKTIMNLNR